MSLQIVIDMNLSPDWVAYFAAKGLTAKHWAECGSPSAADSVIMSWATANSYVVFTHDLDFGTALALTKASAPSVIQLRTPNVLPEVVGDLVLVALEKYEAALNSGALIVVEAKRLRIRVLPFT